jgi:hypothetical protein
MWNQPRIERTGDGDCAVRLPESERELLRRLPEELRAVLELAEDRRCVALPRTYEDDQDEAAYRELMGEELLNGAGARFRCSPNR